MIHSSDAATGKASNVERRDLLLKLVAICAVMLLGSAGNAWPQSAGNVAPAAVAKAVENWATSIKPAPAPGKSASGKPIAKTKGQAKPNITPPRESKMTAPADNAESPPIVPVDLSAARSDPEPARSDAKALATSADADKWPRTEAAARREEQSGDFKDAIEKFCTNIGETAIGARLAWQQKALAELEIQVEDRVVRLDAKIAEHRDWLKRREEFSGKVGNALAQLFAKMRPENAAQRLAAMEEEVAAALLLKLDVKPASALLNEIPAEKAARLASLIADAAEIGKKPGKGETRSPALKTGLLP